MFVAHAPIHLANFLVDFRKSINGLSLLAQHYFAADLQSKAYFVFINHARNKVKILYWDGNGFALWYKRYERIKLKIAFHKEHRVQLISPDQLQWLLSGLDYQQGYFSTENRYDIFY